MFIRFAAASILVLLPVFAEAGTIVLNTDSSTIAALDGSFGVTPNDNNKFFANLLGGGKSVVVAGTGYTTENDILNSFYNSLPGVSSIQVSGAVTASELAGVGLLIVNMPGVSFGTAESAAVRSFLDAGNTLLVIGDNATVVNGTVINNDLAAVGSKLRILVTNVDGGSLAATVANKQILPDQLTMGVNAITYGGLGISLASGGKALALSSDKVTPFIVVERAAVPEPSSIVSLAIAAAIGAGAMRHRLSVALRSRRD